MTILPKLRLVGTYSTGNYTSYRNINLILLTKVFDANKFFYKSLNFFHVMQK